MGAKLRWVRVTCAIGLLFTAPAAAQQTETIEETRSRALELFERGSRAFEAAEYSDALAAFEASYALVPRPEILFNAARSAEEAGQHAVALRYYTQLAASSNSPDERASLEAAVQRVRARADASQQSTESAIPESRDPESRESRDPESREQPQPEAVVPPEADQAPVWPWALAGGGALALVVGVVLTVIGALDVSAINGTPDGERMWSDVAADAERAHALIAAGSVMMGVGAGAGALGLGLALTPAGSGDTAVFVGVGGRF